MANDIDGILGDAVNIPSEDIGPLDPIVDRVYACRKESAKAHADWRAEAREAFQFRDGHQWSSEDRAKLEELGRPIVTFNRVSPILDSITGYEINNRQELKFIPRTDEDAQANEIYTAAAKWVMDGCDGADEETDAYGDAATCGMGWTEWRIDYMEDPDGQIVKERVSPLQMRWDPRARKHNLADARWVLREKRMSLKEIKERWPDAEIDEATPVIMDDEDPINEHDASRAWEYRQDQEQGQPGGDQDPLVLHYQWREREEFYRVPDPQTQQIVSFDAKRFAKIKKFADDSGLPYVKQARWRYRQAFVVGRTLLEESDCPVGGFTYDCITGRRDEHEGTWFGLMRAMKDPQQWANKFFSSAMEIFAANSKGGVMLEEAAVDDVRQFEDKWTDPSGIVVVNDGAITGGKIKERPFGGYPAALDKLMAFAISSIRDCTGVNLELMGMADRDQPGILEIERKKAALVILSPLLNSLKRYRKTSGRKLLEFMQKYIPEGTIMRVANRAIEFRNDAETVKYDVVIDTAPSSPNLKTEVWQTLSQLVPSLVKAGVPIPPSLLKFSPLPESVAQEWIGYIEEVSKRPTQEQFQEVQEQAAKFKKEAETHKNRRDVDMAEIQVERERNQADAALRAIEISNKHRTDFAGIVQDDLDRLADLFKEFVKAEVTRERGNQQPVSE